MTQASTPTTDDEDALWTMHDQAQERLAQMRLGELLQLLRPAIATFIAGGGHATHLIVRAGTHEVTRKHPWPVRFDVDDLHVTWEPSGKLCVPSEQAQEAQDLLDQLTRLHGGLISGEDLHLKLPSVI